MYLKLKLFVENYSSYRVRTKVLTDRQTDGKTDGQNPIPIGCLPSGGELIKSPMVHCLKVTLMENDFDLDVLGHLISYSPAIF